MPRPLENITVLDLGWLMVGPLSARYLAELGATVIKVESSKRPDPLRRLGGTTRAYHMINAGKQSLLLDLKAEKGRAALLELVRRADVLIESFTPGVIDQFGLGWDVVKHENPSLVMVSTGILGRTGSLGKGTSGTGNSGAAFAGATALLAMPGKPPSGPYGPWTDAVAPRFLVASILSALHRRRNGGAGEYIDLAQAEAGLQFLLPAFLDYAVNGELVDGWGAQFEPSRSPCGVYPCQGDDRWMVIDASSDDHWRRLRMHVGGRLLEPELDTLIGRLRRRPVLDAALADWTARHTAAEAEAALQKAGVPAHRLCHDADLAAASDLEAMSFFETVRDVSEDPFKLPGPQYCLGNGRHAPRKPGPQPGDSSRAILSNVAGLSDQDIDGLERAGVLE